MAPKHHPMPLSGGDRKALKKELARSQGITLMLARQSAELRLRGEDMIRRADDLACQSWNERMWSAGEPVDASPTVDQAVLVAMSGTELTVVSLPSTQLHV